MAAVTAAATLFTVGKGLFSLFGSIFSGSAKAEALKREGEQRYTALMDRARWVKKQSEKQVDIYLRQARQQEVDFSGALSARGVGSGGSAALMASQNAYNKFMNAYDLEQASEQEQQNLMNEARAAFEQGQRGAEITAGKAYLDGLTGAANSAFDLLRRR